MADEDLSLKVDLEIGGVIRDLNRVVDGLADAQSASVKYDKVINRLETSATNLSAKVKTLNRDIASGDASARSFRSVQVEADKLAASLEKNVRAGGASSTALNEVANVLSSVQTSLQGASSAYGELTRAQNESVKASQASAKGFSEVEKSQMRRAGVGSSMLYDPNKPRGAASTVPASGLTAIGDFYAGQQRAARTFNAELDQSRIKSSQLFKTFREGQKGTADGYQQQIELQRQAIEQQQEMAKLAARATSQDARSQMRSGAVGRVMNYDPKANPTTAGSFFSGQARAQKDQADALAKTATEAANVQKQFEGIANTRYAMYDVSRALTVISAATLGVSAAIVKTAADFESMFVQVQRTSQTSGAMWDDLRGSLMQLNSELPATVEEITSIATLAGQMGIAAGDIDNFTESVVKFVASTNVSATTGAETLARVAQLAGVAGDEYDKLVASIYQVGVSSVSTESDILSITQQISVSARQAGFAAEQTVALSSALASLGVAPERARGSIQRVFNIITNSVDNGSEELYRFAQISNMTADEFGAKWKNDAQGAFLEFLSGLGRAHEAGENMNNVLSEVGINAVRDSDALRRLAQNTEVYADAIHEANEGWNDGQVFADGYALTADTLANQLLRLGQTIRTIIDAAQDNDLLKGFVGILQNVADIALEIAQSPVGSTLAYIAVVAGGLVGVMALLGAGMAATFASALAMITALQFMSKSMETQATSVGMARTAIYQYIGAVRGMTVAEVQATVAGQGLNKTLIATGGAARVAGYGIRAALITSGVGIAVVALTSAFAVFDAAIRKAGEGAKLTEDELTSLSAAVKADTQAWNEATDPHLSDQFRVMRAEVSTTTESIENNTDAVNMALGSNVKHKDSITGVNEELEDQVTILGENTEQWLRNYAAKELHERFEDDPEGEAYAIRMLNQALRDQQIIYSDLAEMSFNQDIAGLNAVYEQVRASEEENLRIQGEKINQYASLTEAEQVKAKAELEASVITSRQNEELLRQIDVLIEGAGKLDTFAQTEQNAADVAQTMGSDIHDAGEEIEETGEQAQTAAERMDELVDSIFAAVNTRGALVSAMNDIGASLQENGPVFNEYSDAGRANLSALEKAFAAAVDDADGDAHALLGSVEAIISGMEAAGASGVRNLQVVRDMMAAINQDIAASITPESMTPDFSHIPQGGYWAGAKKDPVKLQQAANEEAARQAEAAAKRSRELADQITKGYNDAVAAADESGDASRKAGDNAKKAQKEVRTLSDYVSDLSGLFSSAFDFRFGFQQAEDDSRAAFRAIQEAMDSAEKSVRDLRQSMQDLRATMSGLRSERTVLDYQLRIARLYNDEVREAGILAEIEKNEAAQKKTRDDLTDTTEDLAKEERFLQKNLKGSSKESAEHRDLVLSLVSAYQDQIAEYANTGASQKKVEEYARQLRGEFQRQLTQLGYNKEEIKTYSAAFEDFETIIRRLPRDITIKVNSNTSPAQRALDEFFSKNKDRTITNTVKTRYTTSGSRPNLAKDIEKSILMAKIDSIAATIAGIRANSKMSGYSKSYAIQEATREMERHQRAYARLRHGGYTGPGGTYQPAGIVHAEEFVFNREATRAIGPGNLQAMMEAAQRGSFAMPGMMVQSGAAPQMSGAISLSAGTIQQIAMAVQPHIYLNGNEIGQASNQNNVHDSSVGAA